MRQKTMLSMVIFIVFQGIVIVIGMLKSKK